jgi:hypothetical protein
LTSKRWRWRQTLGLAARALEQRLYADTSDYAGPELPCSCGSCTLPGLGVAAVTFEETEQLLREGIELHIEGMREHGLTIPEPLTQVMRMAISA